jgi:AraC-like DNA-binding protein
LQPIITANLYSKLLTMRKTIAIDDFRDLLIYPEKWKIIAADYQAPGVLEVEAPDYAAKQETEVHDNMREIMIALQGHYVFRFNRKYYQCLPGSVFLIDKNIEHEANYAYDARDILHLWTYTYQKKTVIHLVSMYRNKPLNLAQAFMQPSESPDLDALWDLWKETDNPEKKQWYLQQLKLYLAYAFSLFSLQTKGQTGEETKLELIKIAMEQIQRDLRKGIRIDSLAKMVGYSKFHFMRLFKQYTGRTVMDFVHQCRVKRLGELKKHKVSCKEIATELGFQDVHSFYQWNRRHSRDAAALPKA